MSATNKASNLSRLKLMQTAIFTMSRKNKPAAPKPPAFAKKTNLLLSENALNALARLKLHHGMTHTFAIERGVVMLEQNIVTNGRAS